MQFVQFFCSRCAGETPTEYQARLAKIRIPSEITSRPLADGVGYYYPDGALYGYVSMRK